MNIFITREIHFIAKKMLEDAGHSVTVQRGEPLTPLCIEKDIDALIPMVSDTIDKEFLNSNPQLKVIANYGVGVNNIDLEAAAALNIKVGNTPDVLTEATAELALALTLNISRRVSEGYDFVRMSKWNKWEPLGHLGPALKNKTIGIIGLGRIGTRYAQMLQAAFNCKILFYSETNTDSPKDLKAIYSPLDVLLAASDVVSIHCALTDKTRNLCDKDFFSKMKNGAFFINTARGELHDERALIEALQINLQGAALDVTNPEPINPKSILLTLPNVLVTPHIGSATFEARKAMAELAARNVLAALEDQPMPAPVIS